MKNVEKVGGTGIFTRFIYKALPLAFDESLSYYECLCALLDYLQNTIMPTLNNNADAIVELQELYNELKDYVDNYFKNLDIQEEINNKLDEMAESGQLADIIAQYLEVASVLGFDTKADLKSAENLVEGSITRTIGTDSYNDGKGHFYKIRTLTSGDIVDDDNILALTNYPTLIAEKIPDYRMNQAESNINTIEEEITDINKKPFYNVLINGGDPTGEVGIESILSNAYSEGYYKFYFPQNETKNAIYKINDNVDFTNYEIMTDEGVILSLKNAYSVYGGKYLSNVKIYCRAEEQYSEIPKNIGDLYNSCNLGIDYNKYRVSSYSSVANCQLVIYDYAGDGKFKTRDNITNNYTNDGIYFKLTNNPTFNAVCVPVTDYGNCVETNADNIGQTMHGIICNTNTGQGFYISYNGNNVSAFDESKTSSPWTEYNLHKHNKPNNYYTLPITYKMKYNKETNVCDIYVNESLVGSKKLNFEPNYFGWGVSTNNLKFTRLVRYYQKHVPMNYKLNILIAGDSRFYSGGRPYQVENILKNSLKYTGINDINIDNKSVAGYTLSNINSLIQAQDSNEYDIVIIEGGINNYASSAESIANTTASMIQYCIDNGIIPILTTCMPTAVNGSDAYSNIRSEKYYMISNAMNIGYGTVGNINTKGILIDNMNGSVLNESANAVNPDGVHPSSIGIIEICKGITNAILSLQ